MTPKSSSSPEDQTPPQRPRQTGSPAKPSSEMDLWSFDDDLDADEPDAESKTIEYMAPEPREIEQKAPVEVEEELPAEVILPKVARKQEHPGIRVNIGKAKPKARAQSSIASSDGHVENFDDLDSWDDIDDLTKISDAPVAQKTELDEPSEMDEKFIHTDPKDFDPQLDSEAILDDDHEINPSEAPPKESSSVVSEAQSEMGLESEFTAVQADPAKKLNFKLGLSLVEKVGIIALLVILVTGTALVYFYSINRIPKHALVEKHNFPIKGEHLTLKGAETFWRKPITSGDNPDTPRAGTAVLPVLSISLEGGPAVIRVLFRNDKGELVGDSVTRSIQSNSKVQIAATAGFDDAGMYAAYQAGLEKPWTVEIFEAAKDGVQGAGLSKLFQSKISTESR